MYHQIALNKRKSVLVIVTFCVLWVGIGALIGLIISAIVAHNHTASGLPPLTTGQKLEPIIAAAVIAAFLAVCGILFSLRAGPGLVLRTAGAEPADPVRYQRLHDLVEALAIGDGVPKPDVYVIEDPSPNAFATGTSSKHAAITFTTGLLGMMNREELEGVASHEMSHIKNYDVRLILIVSTLLGMAGLIASILWRSAFFAGGRRNEGQAQIVILAAAALLTIVAFVVGPLIRLALSRSRESLADVSGVELTRNPEGLLSALRKLQTNDQPLRKFNHATAAMCIDDPLQHHESWYHHLFDTHPPIAERIAVLEKIERGESV